MTDQTTPQPEQDDDDSITVGMTLHNPSGEGDTTLSSPVLGLGPYVLIRPGEEGPEFESSHLTADEVASIFALVMLALLQSAEVTDDGRATVSALLEGAL